MSEQTLLELWAKVKDGLDESWITYSENRRAVDAFEAALSGPVAQPVAWVIPTDITSNGADARGFIDARIDRDGEFTMPLYAEPKP